MSSQPVVVVTGAGAGAGRAIAARFGRAGPRPLRGQGKLRALILDATRARVGVAALGIAAAAGALVFSRRR